MTSSTCHCCSSVQSCIRRAVRTPNIAMLVPAAPPHAAGPGVARPTPSLRLSINTVYFAPHDTSTSLAPLGECHAAELAPSPARHKFHGACRGDSLPCGGAEAGSGYTALTARNCHPLVQVRLRRTHRSGNSVGRGVPKMQAEWIPSQGFQARETIKREKIGMRKKE